MGSYDRLRSRYHFKLRRLTEHREEDLGETFRRMAELLGKPEEHGVVQFRLLDNGKDLHRCLELDQNGARVRAEKVDHPDFEIVTQVATWRRIAEGSLSPFEAFIQGEMRVRGDVEFGRRLLRRLASSVDTLDT
jgi:putative sterol carrier protein